MKILIAFLATALAAHAAYYGYIDSGEALPEGIEGNRIGEIAFQFSGDAYGRTDLLTFMPSPIDTSRKKVSGGAIVDMSEAESAIMADEEAAQAAAAEAARQAAKPQALKDTENNFFALCDALGLEGKPGFDEIQAAIETLKLSDFSAAVEASLKLLSIDAAGKRYSATWWDDAIQHEVL